MPHVIVELEPASRFRTAASTLNRDVWEHEARAKEQGLQPVVEFYSRKSELSVRVSKIWNDKPELTADTLDGIYLVRVNATKHGPKALLGLTPRAVMGVPLFLAWGRLGQSLFRTQLNRFEASEIELPLSAFFEDVAAGRAFRFEETTVPETQSQLTPSLEDDAPSATEPNAHVAQLARQLDGYIGAARELAFRSLVTRGLLADLSLESLSELDVLLAEDSQLRGGSAEAQQLIAALAVYFGESMRAYADATWSVDTTQSTLVRALRLQGSNNERRWDIAPAAVLLEAMEDPTRGLLSCAAELCGLLSMAEIAGH